MVQCTGAANAGVFQHHLLNDNLFKNEILHILANEVLLEENLMLF